jgi:hypothetical protein
MMTTETQMTRKDFVLIAAALKAARDSYSPNWDGNLFRACDDHAKYLADALRQTNPAFKRARFLEACGVKGD